MDAPKRGPGRPSKLNPDITKRMADGLQAGMTRVGACHLAGISEMSLWEWMRRGALEPDTEFAKFRKAVLNAEAIAELRLVASVQRDDPKWLLARRYKRWAEKPAEAKVTHQGPGGSPLSVLPQEALLALLAALKGDK